MSSFISSSRPRVFVLVLVAAILGTGGAGLGAAAYFTATGDLLDEEAAAAIQRQGDPACTYFSLAVDNHAAFKYAAYAGRHPRIVALGSSRVLQLSGKLFVEPFYNLGRTMNSMADGSIALRQMVRLGKPEIVLLGIDHWLLSANHRLSRPDDGTVNRTDPFAASQILRLVGTVIRRPELLVAPQRLADGAHCPVGMAGITYHSGFDPAGFYYYGERLMLPAVEQEDFGFRDSLHRVGTGSRRFEHGDQPDPERVRSLAALIRDIEREGIEVIAFMPPVAPSIYDEMVRSGYYGYVGKIREALADAGVEIHDFHDPRALGFVDCEFTDGFHGGDVAYARLLGELARRVPTLRPYLDLAEVRRVGGMAGHATVYFEETFGVPESDFLGLGCTK